MPYKYDLVLKGGEVVDPSQDLRGRRDVGFKDGRVAAVAEEIPSSEASQVSDVAGKMVVPGLIDMHGHFFPGFAPSCIDADSSCLSVGVTTAVDAGTTGWVSFPALREYVIERADTRVLAFIHLSALGQTPLGLQAPDLNHFEYATSERAIRCIEDNRDTVLGLKVRLGPTGTTDENAVPALQMAREIADETDSKVMVHVMESSIPLAQVFEHLRGGDIVTHAFHEDTHNILDAEGEVRPEVREAIGRGVLLDTGNAQRHFSIPVCRAAIQQGVMPHTMGTDRVNPQRPRTVNYDMLDDMSMYIEMGMAFEQVLRAATCNGAAALGRPDLGTLKVGSAGDAAVLEFEDGEFAYEDMLGNEVRMAQRLAHVMTVKDGRRWRPRS